MPETKKKKLVLFGAGKIGRSFIGQLFGRSGYEVVFIDIDKKLIQNINRKRAYKVIIKSEKGDKTLTVENVRGVDIADTDKVINELAEADIAALSVGQQGLPTAIPIIARALVKRHFEHGSWPLDIIIAENMRNCDSYLAEKLKQNLPEGFALDRMAGLIETSIGKMVPIMQKEDVLTDPLQVFAEAYNTLILDKMAFKNPVPKVEGLAPKENMKAWVDRKLFIHNLGHATAAYLGYQKYPEKVFMHEVLADPEIYSATRETMLQSAEMLVAVYPLEFTLPQLEEHIDDLLNRFKNKALGDTIFRVGCDLYRKLGPDDRFAGAINLAIENGRPFDKILHGLVCACHFRAKDTEGKMFLSDIQFAENFDEKGVEWVLTSVCGFNPSKKIKLFVKLQN